LKKSGFQSIQFTFEGDESMHNLRRGLRPVNQGSYTDLMSKILLASQQLEVRIRVNVDWQNASNMPVLMGDLYKLVQNHVIDPEDIDVSTVKDYFSDEEGHSSEQLVGKNKNSLDLLRLVLLHKMASGLGINENDLFPYYPCRFNLFDGYAIDAHGDIYVCGTLFGNSSYAHGNIATSSQSLYSWNRKSGLPEMCLEKNCKYLPSCLGGCPMKSDFHFMDFNQIVCVENDVMGHLRMVMPLLALAYLSKSQRKSYLVEKEIELCMQ
jgi:uncharacterized protein